MEPHVPSDLLSGGPPPAPPRRSRRRAFLFLGLALLLAAVAAGLLWRTLRAARPWTDDWTAPPGYAELLADLTAGRADEGERRMEALFRAWRTDPWRRRALLALGAARMHRREFLPAEKAFARAEGLGGPASPYARLRRGEALSGQRRFAQAAALLQGTAPAPADPVFADDLAIALARAQAGLGDPARARRTLSAQLASARCLDRARVLDAAARIAEEAGDRDGAADLYRRIWLEEPRSREAGPAFDHLSALLPAGRRFRAADLPAAAKRAAALIAAADGKGALSTWDAVLASVPSAPADSRYRLAIAEAAVEARQFGRAYAMLGPPPVRRGDATRGLLLGRALYGLDRGREGAVALRAAMEGAGDPAGDAMYLLATGLDQNDHDREALDLFLRYIQRFRDGDRGQAATWRAAWLSYRAGQRDGAERLFQRLVDSPAAEPYHPSSLYWLGRAREAAGLKARAAALYQELVRRYARDYYGLGAAARLKGMGMAAPAAAAATGPGPASAAGTEELGRPSRSFCSLPAGSATARVQAGCELEEAGLFQEAEREYVAAAAAAAGSSPASAASSRSPTAPRARPIWLRLSEFAVHRGERPVAIERLKTAVPDYLAAPVETLPRRYWEVLYPRPSWEEIEKASRAQSVDPALVCGLILQESAYNPLAVSQAGALGLMQLLPGTGADAARALGEKNFTAARLLEPAMNIRLGTWHLAQVLGRFGRSTELALAAYNAGEGRVQRWQEVFGTSEPTFFVEEIPYTETRLYVKRILSHAAMYRAIYGLTDGRRTACPRHRPPRGAAPARLPVHTGAAPRVRGGRLRAVLRRADRRVLPRRDLRPPPRRLPQAGRERVLGRARSDLRREPRALASLRPRSCTS